MHNIARRLFALCLLVCAGLAAAEVPPQLRAEIEKRAVAMSLAASSVREELRLTGFLDDRKTAALALKSPPAHALAWAALQAEEAQPGTAVALLENVAKGVASRHVDAIRHEPQFKEIFAGYNPGPIPPPPARVFRFERTATDDAQNIARLPPRAQAMLEPLAKYASVHPGGVQGFLVSALKLKPTEALQLERTSKSVEELLPLAITRAAPPPEKRYADVLEALVSHGPPAMQHESILALFPNLAAHDGTTPHGAQWTDEGPLTANVARTQSKREQDIDAFVKMAFGGEPAPPPPPPSSPWHSGPDNGGGGAPSFSERVGNLHAEGLASRGGPTSRLNFSRMRAIGGGLGGGGVVIGAKFSADKVGTPLAAQWEKLENKGNTYWAPRVILYDGAIVYGLPVRGDIAIAARRLVYGDNQLHINPYKNGDGNVLISLLNGEMPILGGRTVTEFLVHPAIADLDIGRELVTCDGSTFLFKRTFARRLAESAVQNPRPGTMSAREWFIRVRQGDFGGWYRYVDRPIKIVREGSALRVKASEATRPEILFEFVVPDDAQAKNGHTSAPPAIVIDGLVDVAPEFRSLNEFISTFGLLRWLRANNVQLAGDPSDVQERNAARTVIMDEKGIVFSARSHAEFLSEDLQARTARWKTVASQKGYKVPTQLLDATLTEKRRDIDSSAMRSLGYSGNFIQQAIDKKYRGKPSLDTVVDSLRLQPHDAEAANMLYRMLCRSEGDTTACKELKQSIAEEKSSFVAVPWWPEPYITIWLK